MKLFVIISSITINYIDDGFYFVFSVLTKWRKLTINFPLEDIPLQEIHPDNIEHWAFHIVKAMENTIRDGGYI